MGLKKYEFKNLKEFKEFELITDTSGNTFSNGTLTKLAFDRGDAAEDFYGNTKQLQYFDKALTDAELQALTQV